MSISVPDRTTIIASASSIYLCWYLFTVSLLKSCIYWKSCFLIPGTVCIPERNPVECIIKFWLKSRKKYGDMVTPSEVTCENVGIVVLARDAKTAPPINARLQKGHCIYWYLSLKKYSVYSHYITKDNYIKHCSASWAQKTPIARPPSLHWTSASIPSFSTGSSNSSWQSLVAVHRLVLFSVHVKLCR